MQTIAHMMQRIQRSLWMIALAAAALPFLASPAAAMDMEPIAPDWVPTCAAGTVPFEAQSWWTGDFGHVHVGFCAPHDQKIKGTYKLKVRVIMHDNPGTLKWVKVGFDTTSSAEASAKLYVKCTGTCAWDRELVVDTTKFPYDGMRHMRVRAVVQEPDGKEMVATNFIPVYLNNGNRPVQTFRDVPISGSTNYVAGRGWYTDANYLWSVVFDPITVGKTVSGTYRVKVRSVINGGPQPISRFLVKLDGTHTSDGVVVYDKAGAVDKPMELAIDTTRLANGWHSLAVRSEAANQVASTCSVCSGQKQTHAGVTKVWFFVQN